MQAVVSSSLNILLILLGNGSGGFTSQVQYTTDLYPKQVIAADFNLDGRADLAVVNNTSNSIQIWSGDGAGGFALNTTLTTGPAPQGAAVADFNGDGVSDIVVCNFGVDDVGVYLGTPAGGFEEVAVLSSEGTTHAEWGGRTPAPGEFVQHLEVTRDAGPGEAAG